MNEFEGSKLTTEYGRLKLEIDFKAGTSRERLMEILAEALYKPDVSLFDDMPEESCTQDWYGINQEARYAYDVRGLDDPDTELI